MKDSTTDFPSESAGPTFADDVPSSVPLDWPDLARDNVAPQARGATPQADNVTRQASDAGSIAQTTVPGSVQSTSGTVQQADEVTLTKSSAKKESRVVQQWRKGERWWRVARKYENGELVAEATLLEVNGTKIADAPKEAP